MKRNSVLLALGCALALSGCISFGAKPPATLMRLTAVESVAARTSRTAPASEAITVVTPTLPQELQTPRVPVRTGETSVAYLKDAQWVEIPGALFGRLLSETIAARTGRVVLDPRQFTFDPGIRLTGTLQAFGVQADRMEAVAVYDGLLARAGQAVETRRFEARVPIAAVDPSSVAPALNEAANKVAADVAAWVGGGPATPAR
ncbi:ABC-type transport auxiliary lipoprotein family protein [Sphingosinicella rhizophila]|uniref:ABC-type transport auxiliary lipoprotein family protein n=1 Tax=Sphingosinicella rhizophila TaxID=3050082 RepID=A0ABU3Q794_9SPHN|nr:ABC-type transport auxiliary lipoprotein family protein [Sphingosinicella sp. GR2756]MDT9599273.1 ABC-type transport auxiliary lipoprotein family protein [Sphingosinicella sp. GR2756]